MPSSAIAEKTSPLRLLIELDDAQHFAVVGVGDGRHQHLVAAIAGALVHLAPELHPRGDRLQLLLVVGIVDVEHLPGEGHVARARCSRQSAGGSCGCCAGRS